MDLSNKLGGDRMVGVGRELTKAHEELVVQPITAALARFKTPRGEFTVLVPPAPKILTQTIGPVDVDSLVVELGMSTKNGTCSKREALKTLSVRRGIPVNELYRLLR